MHDLIEKVRSIAEDSQVDSRIRTLAEAILLLAQRSVQSRDNNREAFSQIEELGKRREPE